MTGPYTYTVPIASCELCGSSWPLPHDAPHACAVVAAREERDAWIRLFNRLDAAVGHHKRGCGANFADDIDEALWAARDRILRDAANNE